MTDWLKVISLDKWWKTVLTVGLVLVLLAFTVEIKVLDNKQVLILGFAVWARKMDLRGTRNQL